MVIGYQRLLENRGKYSCNETGFWNRFLFIRVIRGIRGSLYAIEIVDRANE